MSSLRDGRVVEDDPSTSELSDGFGGGSSLRINYSLVDESPSILRVDKIEVTRNALQLGGSLDDPDFELPEKKIVEKSLPPGAVLPDYIRIRPDLREPIDDENIVQWTSMTSPYSSAVRKDMQTRSLNSFQAGSPKRRGKADLRNINTDALISPDTRDRLDEISETKRLRNLNTLREYKRGTPPATFKKYVDDLVSLAESLPSSPSGSLLLESPSPPINKLYSPKSKGNVKASNISSPKSEINLKVGEQPISVEGESDDDQSEHLKHPDQMPRAITQSSFNVFHGDESKIMYSEIGGFDEKSYQTIMTHHLEANEIDDLSLSVSVKSLNSPSRVNEQKEIKEVAVSRDANLNLYRVTNPNPQSSQAMLDMSKAPLYNEAAALEAERISQASRDKSLLVAHTTLLSKEFPGRPDDDEYFTTEKPSSPHSPFDSKAERVRQLILVAEEERTKRAESRGGGKTPPLSRSRSRQTGYTPKITQHVPTSISRESLICSGNCRRAATLWCSDCSQGYCAVCWVKIPHHDFIKSPAAWKDMELSGSNMQTRALTPDWARHQHSYTPPPVITQGNEFRGDLRLLPHIGDERSTDEQSISTKGSVITPSVYLDASGQIKHDKLTDVLPPDDLVDHSIALDPAMISETGSLNLDRERYREGVVRQIMQNVQQNSTSLLSAMAIQAHQHTVVKKESQQRLQRLQDANQWAEFELKGSLPPVKFSKISEGVLERKRALAKWAQANPKQKLDIDPQKRPNSPMRDTDTPMESNRHGLNQVASESLFSSSSIQSSPSMQLNLSQEEIQLICSMDVNAVDTKQNSSDSKSKELKTKLKLARKTPSISYTATGGIGLGVAYKVNADAKSIHGITKEKLFEHDLATQARREQQARRKDGGLGTEFTSQPERHVEIFNGVAVYTRSLSETTSDTENSALNSPDVSRVNKAKRDRLKRIKERNAFFTNTRDTVLDAISIKPNPLLVDIYGPAYQRMSGFKPLTYDNVPAPKPLNKTKQNTLNRIVTNLESTGFNDSLSLSEEMNSLMSKPQESLDYLLEKKGL